MRRSEIFDSFVKIAQEKGMISNDSSDSKKKLEETGRADSLDISAIEALYGVKPNTPKDMEYKKNIMEDAHPNSVVISPSYDKLNGLVENNIERQNIILHIVQKTPDGLSTQRKYAEKELTLSLVRIANDLDNRDEEKLRALADFCLLQVNQEKGLKKEAIAPVVVVLLVAAVIGYYYAQQHLPNANYGLENSMAKLISEIDDLINSQTHWYGTGYELNPQIKTDMTKFKDNLLKFWNLYKKNEPVMNELQRPKEAQELIQQAQSGTTTSTISAYKELKASIDNLLPFLDQVEKNFSSQAYKDQMIKDRGVLTGLVDSLRIGDTSVLHGGYGLFLDDFDDVVHAIKPVKDSVKNVLDVFSKAQSIEEDAKNQLQQASFKSNQLFGPEPGSAGTAPGATNPNMLASQKKPGKTVEDLDKESEELSKMLGGFA